MSVYAQRGFTARHPARAGGTPGVACAVLLAWIAGCSSGSSGGGTSGDTGGTGGGTNGGAGVYSGGDRAPTSTGTIAYASGNELRLIEPDGSGDHVVWTEPDSGISGVTYSVTAPAWRPNGWEIAFSSNHEQAYSIFERDIYAVRPDGGGLRKLTNAPTRDQAATYPKGNVRVTVQNDDVAADHIIVIVQGAEPQGLTLPAGSRQTITITGVADLGPGVQQGIVAAVGTFRFNGPTVDVAAEQTVDAPIFYVHANSRIPDFTADKPFWRSDSSKVGYIGPYCSLMKVASNPPPGYAYQGLVGADAFTSTCAAEDVSAEWGPTPATATQVIANDDSDYPDTYVVHVAELTEGATTKPPPVYSLDPSIHVTDLQWLPDGSGFLFARRNSQLEYDVNIWEYRFATGTATQLTDVHFDGVMRRFAVSPDGRKIAFEMVDTLYGDSPVIGYCDLWIMNRDGSGAKLLAQNGWHPAWNPTR